MRRRLILLLFCLFISTPVFALNNNDIVTFSNNNLFGLKEKASQSIIIDAKYKKLIRLGQNAWIVQNKKNKYGLISNNGDILVPLKYNHADRLVSTFVKLGNYNDFGIYDENGTTIVPPKYSKIEIMYGHMFLTYKHYKYGLYGYNGKVILDNEFDDIYMPKPNLLRIQYNGKWFDVEAPNDETLDLSKIETDEDFAKSNILITTGAYSGYSVLSFSDYVIKIVSSISPAHEQTIDELLLSQGADTVNIFLKFRWLAKYPYVYCRKYAEYYANYNNGPFSNVRSSLKQQMR